MSTTMTHEERDAFLTEVRIGVLTVDNDERGPLVVPIWYIYNPGEDLWMITGGDSRKGKLLKKAKRVGFCVHDDNAPYRYVSMEGPITIETADPDVMLEDIRQTAHRYYGVEAGDAYVAAQKDFFERSEPILVRLRPEHWLTCDLSKEVS